MNNIPKHLRNPFKAIQTSIIIPTEKKLLLEETQPSTHRVTTDENLQGNMNFMTFRGIAPPKMNDHSLYYIIFPHLS